MRGARPEETRLSTSPRRRVAFPYGRHSQILIRPRNGTTPRLRPRRRRRKAAERRAEGRDRRGTARRHRAPRGVRNTIQGRPEEESRACRPGEGRGRIQDRPSADQRRLRPSARSDPPAAQVGRRTFNTATAFGPSDEEAQASQDSHGKPGLPKCDDDVTSLAENLAGDPGVPVTREMRVEDRVRDEVADLVRVTLGNGLRREYKLAGRAGVNAHVPSSCPSASHILTFASLLM